MPRFPVAAQIFVCLTWNYLCETVILVDKLALNRRETIMTSKTFEVPNIRLHAGCVAGDYRTN